MAADFAHGESLRPAHTSLAGAAEGGGGGSGARLISCIMEKSTPRCCELKGYLRWWAAVSSAPAVAAVQPRSRGSDGSTGSGGGDCGSCARAGG